MAARANAAAESAAGHKAISRVGRYMRMGNKIDGASFGGHQLGKGSYGVVYAAWDSTEHRLVAIKEQPVRSPDAMTEMCIMQMVGQHGRLVELWDVLVIEDKLVLVLEYLPCSLADTWKRAGGFLDWDLCYNYGRQVLEAVDFLHAQSVVHRDISLNNILVDGRNNAVKLADFGMAASADTFHLDRTVTALNYRAPEAILSATLPRGQTPLDMWSLATVWAVLWSASNVFQGRSLPDVFRRHAHVLGGTPVREWPECREASKWGDMEGALLAEFPHSGPRDFFLSSDVRRPLHSHEQIMDLLCKVLKWHPCKRLSACDALGHPAWKHVPQSAEPPSQESVPVIELLCKCRGHCGLSRCNRNKARIHHLKKTNKEVLDEYICQNRRNPMDPRGRCHFCQEADVPWRTSAASKKPTPPVSQTKASDEQKRKQEAKVKGRVQSKASQNERRRDSKKRRR